MKKENDFDVIIIGGSYSGLAAAMALGRALKHVLIIDSGEPCNRQTPHSHNFLTQDGKTPTEITTLAREQVQKYDTIIFLKAQAIRGTKTTDGFRIETNLGETYSSRKLVFATGIKDVLPEITELANCWGISVLHCPYCHGYEVKDAPTGILGNGDYGFEFSILVSNWTKTLSLFTNGKSTLTQVQVERLNQHGIEIIEKEIDRLDHYNGSLQRIFFKNGTISLTNVLYTRPSFEQHCVIPESLGCELTADGYIKTDITQSTTVHGIYACGDNTTRIRTVANAVAMGTTAGMMVNKEICTELF